MHQVDLVNTDNSTKTLKKQQYTVKNSTSCLTNRKYNYLSSCYYFLDIDQKKAAYKGCFSKTKT
jgi:hypothetical protein